MVNILFHFVNEILSVKTVIKYTHSILFLLLYLQFIYSIS